MRMFELDTERLRLRSFQDSDLDAFVAYRSDPDIARYQGWDAPYPVAQAREFIAKLTSLQPATPGEWYQIAIELKSNGRFIGDCAFCVLADDIHQAEIAFTLARAYHGQGYAMEAVTGLLDYLFGDLGLHRVRAICDAENRASAKLLERIGMRREGEFVENIWFKGRWGSEYWYAVLDREWAASRRPCDLQQWSLGHGKLVFRLQRNTSGT